MTKNKKKKMNKKQKKQRELLETQLAQVRIVVFWEIRNKSNLKSKKIFQLEKYEFSDGGLESGRQRLAGSSLCAGKRFEESIF